jgi:hypothetical protein
VTRGEAARHLPYLSLFIGFFLVAMVVSCVLL